LWNTANTTAMYTSPESPQAIELPATTCFNELATSKCQDNSYLQ